MYFTTPPPNTRGDNRFSLKAESCVNNFIYSLSLLYLFLTLHPYSEAMPATLRQLPTAPYMKISAISLLEDILAKTLDRNATDIHISPTPDYVSIRIRVDGFLEELTTLPTHLHQSLIARIKILAHLRTDKRFSAQDGRFSHTLSQQSVDVRVSITPAYYGENVVLRILTQHTTPYSLQDLGCAKEQRDVLRHAITQTGGLVLATGPTGSGKTTLLYTLLSMLDKQAQAVVTLEDPIEYSIPGINQIPVGSERSLSFANGLRSVLRQDPDIIMLGEIRDAETATLAVHAALTGHLVLSTLHTRDAFGVIARLHDMGIAPYLIAATLHTVVATRLARRLCIDCRIEYTPKKKSLLAQKDIPETLHLGPFFTSTGCESCRSTGVHGRIGIFETLSMNETLRKRILSPEPESESPTPRGLLHDAYTKAHMGIISCEEAVRMTRT